MVRASTMSLDALKRIIAAPPATGTSLFEV
jgi:hypothetical protein